MPKNRVVENTVEEDEGIIKKLESNESTTVNSLMIKRDNSKLVEVNEVKEDAEYKFPSSYPNFLSNEKEENKDAQTDIKKKDKKIKKDSLRALGKFPSEKNLSRHIVKMAEVSKGNSHFEKGRRDSMNDILLLPAKNKHKKGKKTKLNQDQDVNGS